jgi:predicted Zn-dependent peptidase
VVLGEVIWTRRTTIFLRYRRAGRDVQLRDASQPLGSRSVVMATTSAQLREAHGTYYVPNNALLVVSGDTTMNDSRALAEAYFGDWTRGEDPIAKNPPPRPTPMNSSRYVVLEAPISDTRIEIGWSCPGTRDDRKGAMAGALLSAVTYQSNHRFRSLVTPGLATSASFAFVPNQYASYVAVDITVPQGVEDEALRTAKDALDGIGIPGDVTPDHLRIAKDSLWTSYFYASDDPDRLPAAIARQWSLADVEAYESYLDDLYAIGQEDLDRFAAGCVRGRPHVVILQTSSENIFRSGIDEAFLESRL